MLFLCGSGTTKLVTFWPISCGHALTVDLTLFRQAHVWINGNISYTHMQRTCITSYHSTTRNALGNLDTFEPVFLALEAILDRQSAQLFWCQKNITKKWPNSWSTLIKSTKKLNNRIFDVKNKDIRYGMSNQSNCIDPTQTSRMIEGGETGRRWTLFVRPLYQKIRHSVQNSDFMSSEIAR